MLRRLARVGVAGCVALLACGGGGGGADVSDVPGGDTVKEGDPCDDGDPCTFGDKVQGGACVGTEHACPTGKSPYCVAAECDGAGGCRPLVDKGFCFIDGACFASGAKNPDDACGACVADTDALGWSPPTAAPGCSDGDPCTKDDRCDGGKCVGTPDACDDDNVCTKDSCDSKLGCRHDDAAGGCDDSDACTLGDTCGGGKCLPGADAPDCDDKNPCTVDSCNPAKGCVSELAPAVACDDHNECTADTCEPGTGCAHEAVAGPCDDDDACTIGDACDGEVCEPGIGAPDCDDDNGCTSDSCSPAVGCVHANLQIACDDGDECTENDACLVGKCAGKKTVLCDLCEYPANPDALKVTSLQFGTGHAGGGLDLDDNPSTCAPEASCSNGIDNELGVLGALANDGLVTSLKQGTLKYVFEIKDFSTAMPFRLNLLDTGVIMTTPPCNFQFDECDYYPAQDSLDLDCNPIITFDNATVTGNVLRAGGKAYSYPLQASLIGGQLLVLGIASARVEATLLWEDDQIVGMEGFLGGGVAKEQLMDTVNKLPDWVFAPMDKAGALAALDSLIENDLDIDGDGVPDAASINLKFQTIPANVVTPPLPE